MDRHEDGHRFVGPAPQDGVARRVGALLVQLDRRRYVVSQRAELGVAPFRLLWLLTEEPRTLRQLAGALELEASTINRQVNALVRAGLARRVPGGRGARVLEPTAEGVAAFERDCQTRLRHFSRALAKLPAADAARFVELLGAFAAAYDEAVQEAPDT